MVQDDAGPKRPLTVGVPRERIRDERRVALVPETVGILVGLGYAVTVESGAGRGGYFSDDSYSAAGATVESKESAVYEQADLLAKVQPPLIEETERMRPGSLLLSFLDPGRDGAVARRLADCGITVFSYNLLPRITRAQSMDAMSAMSTVAGYRAVLLAAEALGRFFPLLMTAAGTVPPARVIVIGAGVAGLQALATAKRLGARTAACDARAAAREQIESVGAAFIDMSVADDEVEGEGGYARAADEDVYRRERDAIRSHIAEADVVISTAQVPGARAPMLIDELMIRAMKPGSVVVDLAAETGGNCELTVLGSTVSHCDVAIIGPANLASSVPVHASQMLSRCALNVIKHVTRDGEVQLDYDDDIIRGACLPAPVKHGA